MQAIKNIIFSVLSDLQTPELMQRNRLATKWPEIVGPKLAQHTQPSLGQHGQLHVWVNQSTLAFEVNQRYKMSILKRAQAELGEEAVKTVRVYVGQPR